ncbi:MAG: hypothetical protein ACI31R_01490 [Bacilli bacterium]
MEKEKVIIDITDEEILEEFTDIIDDLLADDSYKSLKGAIKIVRDALQTGVDRHDHAQILYRIGQAQSIRISKELPGATSPLCRSSNKKIIKAMNELEEKIQPYDITVVFEPDFDDTEYRQKAYVKSRK